MYALDTQSCNQERKNTGKRGILAPSVLAHAQSGLDSSLTDR